MHRFRISRLLPVALLLVLSASCATTVRRSAQEKNWQAKGSRTVALRRVTVGECRTPIFGSAGCDWTSEVELEVDRPGPFNGKTYEFEMDARDGIRSVCLCGDTPWIKVDSFDSRYHLKEPFAVYAFVRNGHRDPQCTPKSVSTAIACQGWKRVPAAGLEARRVIDEKLAKCACRETIVAKPDDPKMRSLRLREIEWQHGIVTEKRYLRGKAIPPALKDWGGTKEDTQDQAAYCYEQTLLAKPATRGKVLTVVWSPTTLRFVTEESSPAARELEACLTSYRWKPSDDRIEGVPRRVRDEGSFVIVTEFNQTDVR